MEHRWKFRFSRRSGPTGPCVELAAHEMEKLLLSRLAAQQAQPEDALWSLARFYCEQRRIDDAISYLELLLDRTPNPEGKSGILLAMGQAMEHGEQYPPAIRYYMQAF